MFLGDIMRRHTTLSVRNIHMLDLNELNRLLSFKNDLVIVDTHLLLLGENALSTELTYIFSYEYILKP